VLKGGLKKDNQANTTAEQKRSKPFTPEQLKDAWQTFAEKHKALQVTYHLLSQGFEFRENKVIIQLHNHFQETLLDEIRLELLTFLRDRLGNDSIQLAGEINGAGDDKKVLYTNKEKLDHLIEKNPLVKELKDKLGLDTDF
jgi:DNA polymerase-3 subunit gamma/tau